jgi:hypothetical protein
MLTPVSTAVAQPGGQVLSTGVSVLLHRLQYVPGDLVSGSVQLALKTARGVKELVVAFQGTDARTERGRTTTGLLFKVTKKLVASPTGVPKKMSGGVFTYPFSFSTRTDLPSTCFLSNPDGTSRRVLYELQAHLKLQRGKNRSVHQEIALAGKPTTMSTPTLTDVSLTDATDNGPAREAPRRPSDTPPSTVTPKSDAPTRRPSRNPPPPEPMLPAAVATPSPLSGAIASTATDAAAPGSPAVSRIRPALSRRQHLRADIRGGVASMSNSNLDPQAMVEIEAIHVQYDEQIQEVLDELMRRELLEVSARFDASLEAMRQVLNEKLAEAH